MKRYERRYEAQRELELVQKELRENLEIGEGLEKRRRELFAKQAELKNTIAQLTPTKFTITDHAVLRYMERSKGLDVAAVRNEIMGLVIPLADMGVGTGEVAGFKIKDNTVVTYIGKD